MSSPADPLSFKNFVQYNEALEVIAPGEEQVFTEISQTMRQLSATFNDRARHAYRPVHAKSHGLLKGTLQVYDNLSEPYRQGLFAESAAYPVLLRLSTNPGDILPDSISTPRGLALKVMGLAGKPMVPEHAGQATQDFLLVDGPAFGAPNSNEFLKQLQLLLKHAGDSQTLKQIVSTAALAAGSAAEAFGREIPLLKQFGHPRTNLLGESYFSQVPLRYGRLVAKISCQPFSENLRQLIGQSVEIGDNYSALRDTIVHFFQNEGAEWEIKAQLCSNLTTMPIEDASVEWPESESPFVPVARIIVPQQEAYSAARRVHFDEFLSFNPWHALADHRPLGNVNRARQRAYIESTKFRHYMNGREMVEPREVSEIPD